MQTKLKNFPVILIFLAVLGGCIQPAMQQTPTVENIEPSVTSAPWKTSTPTPTQTPTETRVPTLAPEEANDLLALLLIDNGNCTSPCFWGFKIHEAGMLDVENFVASLGLPTQKTGELGGSFWTHYEMEAGERVEILFASDDQSVLSSVEIDGSDLSNGSGEVSSWEYFEPANVLRKFGAPDFARFELIYGPEGRFDYEIILSYHVEEMSFSYISATKDSFSPVICPFMDNEVDDFQGVIGASYLRLNNSVDRLDQVSSLSLEDFASLAWQDPADACFTLNPGVYQP